MKTKIEVNSHGMKTGMMSEAYVAHQGNTKCVISKVRHSVVCLDESKRLHRDPGSEMVLGEVIIVM